MFRLKLSTSHTSNKSSKSHKSHKSHTSRLAIVLAALAAVITLSLNAFTQVKLDISQFQGKNCRWLTDKIYEPALHDDAHEEFVILEHADPNNPNETLAEARKLVAAVQAQTEPDVFKKYLEVFNKEKSQKDQMEDLAKLLASLAGMKMTNLSDRKLIDQKIKDMPITQSKLGLDGAILEPFLMLAADRGVLMQLDGKDTAFIAVGYRPGDIKSDRNFVMSATQKYRDPSDSFFLKAGRDKLEQIKNDDEQFKLIYKVTFELLFKSDLTNFHKLDAGGKTLVANLFGIFMAEAARASDSDYKSHLWQNALAEAFLDSAFVVEVHKVLGQGGKLITGDPTAFFGIGTQGSGIGGKTGLVRGQFQRMITSTMRNLDATKGAVAALEAIIGKRADDIDGMFRYVMDEGMQNEGELAQADALIDAAVNFQLALKKNAKQILEVLENQQGGK